MQNTCGWKSINWISSSTWYLNVNTMIFVGETSISTYKRLRCRLSGVSRWNIWLWFFFWVYFQWTAKHQIYFTGLTADSRELIEKNSPISGIFLIMRTNNLACCKSSPCFSTPIDPSVGTLSVISVLVAPNEANVRGAKILLVTKNYSVEHCNRRTREVLLFCCWWAVDERWSCNFLPECVDFVVVDEERESDDVRAAFACCSTSK